MSEIPWQPSSEKIRNTAMNEIYGGINSRHGKAFSEYLDLYEWSIKNIHYSYGATATTSR